MDAVNRTTRLLLLALIVLTFLGWYRPPVLAQDVRITIRVTVRLCEGSLAGVTDSNTVIPQCGTPGAGVTLAANFRPDGYKEENYTRTTGSDGAVEFPVQDSPGELFVITDDGVGDLTGNWIALASSDDDGNYLAGPYYKDYGTEQTAIAYRPTQNHENITVGIYLYNPNAELPTPKSTLVVNTWSCDGDAYHSTVEQWMQFCTGKVAALTVILTSRANENDFKTMATDGNGTLSVPVQPGDYSIQTPIPAGFNDGALACQETSQEGNVIGDWHILPLRYTGGRGGLAVTGSGNTVTCWFLFYNTTDGTLNPGDPGIKGQALLCDSDLSDLVPSTDGEAIIATDCPLVASEVPLTLRLTNGTNQQINTSPDGSFEFLGLPAGSYGLSAPGSTVNDGLNAFCVTISGGSADFETSYKDAGSVGMVTIPLESAEDVVRCRLLLYNSKGDKPGTDTTPSDKAEIRNVARLCPDGFSSSNFDQLDATCSHSDESVSFTVTGSTTATATSTGESTAAFPGLDPGLWTVTETTPEGFGQSVVFCTVNPAGQFGANVQMAVSGGNSISQTLAADDLMLCSWFNTTEQVIDGTTEGGDIEGDDEDAGGIQTGPPASDPDLGTLVIVLHMCPEDFNPDAKDADPVDECEELVDGVNISATNEDGQKKRRQTGESEPGMATYTNLKSGTYRLHQGFPAGVESAFVWTCESDEREFEYPYIPFARIDGSGSIKVVIEAPETLTCDWYNMPVPNDEDDDDDRDEPESPRDSGGDEADIDDGGQDDEGSAESGGTSVSVTVLTCPGIPNRSSCDPAQEGFVITFARPGSDPIDIETDGDGVATALIPPGTYTVDGDSPPCFMDSAAATDSGQLQVQAGSAVEVELFVCT